jgi:hypothetical protein
MAHVLHQMPAKWCHPTASRWAKKKKKKGPKMAILAHFGAKMAKNRSAAGFDEVQSG